MYNQSIINQRLISPSTGLDKETILKILKDIVAYCLNDIENLKGMTLGETCIIGEVAEQLQYLNGVLYESAEFSAENSILINAGEIQEDAWQRLVNSIFKDEDHPRDDKGRFIDKLVNEHIMYVRSKEKQITKDVREIAKKRLELLKK